MDERRNEAMTPQEESALRSTVSEFFVSYAAQPEGTDDWDWLLEQLRASLPEKDEEDLTRIRDAIVGGIQRHEETRASLDEARAKGMSHASWFARRMEETTSGMSGAEAASYMQSVHEALYRANGDLWNAFISREEGGDPVEAHENPPSRLIPPGQEWNEYTLKTAAKGLVENAGAAGFLGLLSGARDELERQLAQGEEFSAASVVQEGLKSGASGVKTVVAGALETVVERGMLKALPKGIAPETATDLAHVAVENVRIFTDVASGELNPAEAVERAGDVAVAAVCTQVEEVAQKSGAQIGMEVGARIGSVFGPTGALVGGAIGGAVGWCAGTKVGQAVTKGAKKVYGYLKEKVYRPVVKAGRRALEWEKSRISSLFSWW